MTVGTNGQGYESSAMRIVWEIDADEVSRVRAFLEEHRDNWFVKNRIKCNLCPDMAAVAVDDFWHKLVGCLLQGVKGRTKSRTPVWSGFGLHVRASAARGGNMSGSNVEVSALIRDHFEPILLEDVAITERVFPHRVRADLQRAVDRLLDGKVLIARFSGVRKRAVFEGISFTDLLVRDANDPTLAVPPTYEEIDIGEEQPVRCLKNGLWLLVSDGTKYAVFLEQYKHRFGQSERVRVQVAVAQRPTGAPGRPGVLRAPGGGNPAGRVVPGQDPLAGAGRPVFGQVLRHPGPSAVHGRAGSGHSAGSNARTAGAQCPAVRRPSDEAEQRSAWRPRRACSSTGRRARARRTPSTTWPGP